MNSLHNLRGMTPVPMWFVDAPLVPEKIRGQLAQIKAQQYAGVLPIIITPEIANLDWKAKGLYTPEPYLSEEYFQRFDVIVESCRQHQLALWIWDDLYCPAGWAGGLLTTRRPDLHSVMVRRRHHTGTMNEPVALGELCRTADFVYELVKDSHRIDMYHPDASKTFLDITHEAYYHRYADDFGKTITAFFHDEPGTPGSVRTDYRLANGFIELPLAWSSVLPEMFMATYGYDIIPHLPKLWIDEPADADAVEVRAAFARLVNTMWIRHWLVPLRAWCHDHGVLFIGHHNNDEGVEAHANTAGNLAASLKTYHIPGIDIVTGQVYPNMEAFPPSPDLPYNALAYNGHFPRFAASAARQQGGGLALAEIGGVYGAGWSLRHRKWLSDFVFSRGIAIHNVGALSYSNEGHSLFMYLDGCNEPQPYYPYISTLNTYLSTTAHLLSMGQAATRHAVWYSPATYETRHVEHASEYFDGLMEFLEYRGIEPDILGPDDAQAALLYDTIYLPAQIFPDKNERQFLRDACAHAQIWAPHGLAIEDAGEYRHPLWNIEASLLDNALAVYGDLGERLCPILDIPAKRRCAFTAGNWMRRMVWCFSSTTAPNTISTALCTYRQQPERVNGMSKQPMTRRSYVTRARRIPFLLKPQVYSCGWGIAPDCRGRLPVCLMTHLRLFLLRLRSPI